MASWQCKCGAENESTEPACQFCGASSALAVPRATSLANRKKKTVSARWKAYLLAVGLLAFVVIMLIVRYRDFKKATAAQARKEALDAAIFEADRRAELLLQYGESQLVEDPNAAMSGTGNSITGRPLEFKHPRKLLRPLATRATVEEAIGHSDHSTVHPSCPKTCETPLEVWCVDDPRDTRPSDSCGRSEATAVLWIAFDKRGQICWLMMASHRYGAAAFEEAGTEASQWRWKEYAKM